MSTQYGVLARSSTYFLNIPIYLETIKAKHFIIVKRLNVSIV